MRLFQPHSCKCLCSKDTYPKPIHANAFRPKEPFPGSFMQLLFDQGQLLLFHSCKCFLVKFSYRIPLREVLSVQRHLFRSIHPNAFRSKTPLRRHSCKCFSTNAPFAAPFMQMLFDQCHRLRPHSCKCFQLKAPFYCPIHANAFQLKASSRLIHARGFQRRHLTQTHSSKCFYKGHFSPPIEANAFHHHYGIFKRFAFIFMRLCLLMGPLF